MLEKDWDYLVIRRTHNGSMGSFDWDEFSSTIHAYSKKGYKPQGGVSICQASPGAVEWISNTIFIVAQAMFKERIEI